MCCLFIIQDYLLIIHGHHKKATLTLSLGIVVIVVFTFGVPGAYLGIRYLAHETRKKLKAAKAAYNAEKEKATFVNIVNETFSVNDIQVLDPDT